MSCALRRKQQALRGIASSPRPGSADAPPRLRLCVVGGQLALELAEPVHTRPGMISALSVRLPKVTFPVDLSGGVSRFRHRRGTLVDLAYELSLDELEATARPVARRVFGQAHDVAIAAIEHGVRIGVYRPDAAFAFDALAAPTGRDLRIVVSRPRSLGFDEPAMGLALRLLKAMSSRRGESAGSVWVIDDLAGRIARWLLPEAGARAPHAELPVTVQVLGERVHVRAADEADDAQPDYGSLAALELCELTLEADEAMARADYPQARQALLRALLRAPKHRTLMERLADIDRAAGDRAEAALGMLVDVVGAADAGLLGASLLEQAGDDAGAYGAFVHAAHRETFAPLAGLAWARAARLAPDRAGRREALDAAASAAPMCPSLRWERLDALLDDGDWSAARAEASLLFAAAKTVEERRDAARELGRRHARAGASEAALSWLGQAHRIAVSDPDLAVELAEATERAGQPTLALERYARAVRLADAAGKLAGGAKLALAKGLARTLGDRSSAIARARSVGEADPLFIEAKRWEAKWLAELGEQADASLAGSAMLRAIDRRAGEPHPDWAAWLVETGDFEAGRGQAKLAEAHFSSAARLNPGDPRILSRLRALPAPHAPPPLQGPPHQAAPPPAAASQEPFAAALEPAHPSFALSPEPSLIEEPSEGALPPEELELEARAEHLKQVFLHQPASAEVFEELTDVLLGLGRDHELLALVSSRWEDSEGDEREALTRLRRSCLARLRDQARSHGNIDEAEMFASMLELDS